MHGGGAAFAQLGVDQQRRGAHVLDQFGVVALLIFRAFELGVGTADGRQIAERGTGLGTQRTRRATLADARQETLAPGGERRHPRRQRLVVIGQQQLESVIDAGQFGGGIRRDRGQGSAHAVFDRVGDELRLQQCEDLLRGAAAAGSGTGHQPMPFGGMQGDLQGRKGGGELSERGHRSGVRRWGWPILARPPRRLTSSAPGNYSFASTVLSEPAMSGTSIAELEHKIDRLVATSARLKAENEMLREREASLARERSQLLEKNERARTKIENMIARLKALAPES